MTVRELIEKLEQFPDDDIVVIFDGEYGEDMNVSDVIRNTGKSIWIQSGMFYEEEF